jgi:hypothetical protein
MSTIPGVAAVARCSICELVMWTDETAPALPQACTCRCGATQIINDQVIGAPDATFNPTTFEELIEAEDAN